jgi:hypothetical protein
VILLIGSAVCVALGFVVDKISDQISGCYWLDGLSAMMVFGGIVAFTLTVFVGFMPSIVDFVWTQLNQLWSL